METENKVEFCGTIDREGKVYLNFKYKDRTISIPSDKKTAHHILSHLSKICASPGRELNWGNEE